LRETKAQFKIRIILALILLNFALIHIIKAPLVKTETESILEVKVLGEAINERDVPLVNASVTVWPTNKEFEFRVSNKTDNVGITTFYLPRKTNYSISASAPDYNSEQIEIDLTKTEEPVPVVIIKLKKSGEIGWSATRSEINLQKFIVFVLIFATIATLMIGIYARKKDNQARYSR